MRFKVGRSQPAGSPEPASPGRRCVGPGRKSNGRGKRSRAFGFGPRCQASILPGAFGSAETRWVSICVPTTALLGLGLPQERRVHRKGGAGCRVRVHAGSGRAAVVRLSLGGRPGPGASARCRRHLPEGSPGAPRGEGAFRLRGGLLRVGRKTRDILGWLRGT